MKIRHSILAIVFASNLYLASPAFGQNTQPALPTSTETNKTTVDKSKTVAQEENQDEGSLNQALPNTSSQNVKISGQEQLSVEEAAVLPHYNNFLREYRLGPEDVISIEVFAQCPNYCKTGVTVPPDGRISYPLIREGIFVVNKTRQQIADEITKKLDEYIIDPKVTVSLDKAVSMRYSVLGDVVKPGAQVMSRRLSVYEAIAEAGGFLPTGNRKEVIVLRSGADGRPRPLTVNLKDVQKGRATEMVFLEPGDQVIVQGNKIKAWQTLLNSLPVIGFASGMIRGNGF